MLRVDAQAPHGVVWTGIRSRYVDASSVEAADRNVQVARRHCEKQVRYRAPCRPIVRKSSAVHRCNLDCTRVQCRRATPRLLRSARCALNRRLARFSFETFASRLAVRCPRHAAAYAARPCAAAHGALLACRYEPQARSPPHCRRRPLQEVGRI
ncbi:hypothetical protein C6T59_20380 [Burkholderia multivorans]|nr:hypothetical protein C6Q01_23125 [Burkholderia multivorans]PRF89371.1 hypothetical protein C6Q23_15200 [Burkholderia multivorans]PRG63367.1 hypothetical protein C6T59_20380 [Burkholderia multivorans]